MADRAGGRRISAHLAALRDIGSSAISGRSFPETFRGTRPRSPLTPPVTWCADVARTRDEPIAASTDPCRRHLLVAAPGPWAAHPGRAAPRRSPRATTRVRDRGCQPERPADPPPGAPAAALARYGGRVRGGRESRGVGPSRRRTGHRAGPVVAHRAERSRGRRRPR
jgi:hypothetical protein